MKLTKQETVGEASVTTLLEFTTEELQESDVKQLVTTLLGIEFPKEVLLKWDYEGMPQQEEK